MAKDTGFKIETNQAPPVVHDQLGPSLTGMAVSNSIFIADEAPTEENHQGADLPFGGRAGLNLLRYVELLINRHVAVKGETFQAAVAGRDGQAGVRVWRVA